MARDKKLGITFFLVSLIFLGSCRSNFAETSFRTNFVSGDSLASYSLGIYARIVGREQIENINIPIEVIITSPSGKVYTDVINLPLNKSKNRQVGRWMDIMWNYREGVRFPENGEWQFSIISGKSGTEKLREVGIVIERGRTVIE
jgi:hypothetical protein